MKDIHSIQLNILQTLLFQPNARFADLNNTGVTNDHFSFHLKHLITKSLIEKTADGYKLTPKGMEIAGRIDTDNSEIVVQPKLGVAVCLIKDEQGIKYVLLNKRLKNQAIGQLGLHTEKVKLGEKLVDTLTRCIQREIGDIKYEEKFMGISHALIYDGEDLSLDVVLHCFKVNYHSGDILDSTKEGENSWVEVSKIDQLPNLMSGVDEVIKKCSHDETFFIETQAIVP